MCADYGDQGQRRSAERKAWVKTIFYLPDNSTMHHGLAQELPQAAIF